MVPTFRHHGTIWPVYSDTPDPVILSCGPALRASRPVHATSYHASPLLNTRILYSSATVPSGACCRSYSCGAALLPPNSASSPSVTPLSGSSEASRARPRLPAHQLLLARPRLRQQWRRTPSRDAVPVGGCRKPIRPSPAWRGRPLCSRPISLPVVRHADVIAYERQNR